MEARLFANGDQMPALGLGTWKARPGQLTGPLRHAVQIGYRHIDCAYIYGNESEVGDTLVSAINDGIVSRKDLWITSKLWNDMHAQEEVQTACKNTLSNLKLDYLDLYLIHWPVLLQKGIHAAKSADDFIKLDTIPIIETWRGMEALVDKGLCRHIGVCNFSRVKLQSLLGDARIKPEMNQIELHPYLQQQTLIEFCNKNGIHVTGYAPLGSIDRPIVLKAFGEPILLKDPKIAAIADKHNASPAQVLISWALERGTAVIPKSVRPERLQENLDAAALTLTQDDLEQIATMDIHHRYISGKFWALKGSPYTLASLWDE